jgi:hypothetical protein
MRAYYSLSNDENPLLFILHQNIELMLRIFINCRHKYLDIQNIWIKTSKIIYTLIINVFHHSLKELFKNYRKIVFKDEERNQKIYYRVNE